MNNHLTTSYVIPYTRIKCVLDHHCRFEENVKLIRYEDFLDSLRQMLACIPFDEVWYANYYRDIKELQIKTSRVTSLRQHFSSMGYFEGRRAAEHDRALPFGKLKKEIDIVIKEQGLFLVGIDNCLRRLLGGIVKAIPLDEDWYYNKYEDVRRALDGNRRFDLARHFSEFGYFESRLPFEMLVDEEWYSNKYKDVGEALRLGRLTSSREHFFRAGYREGRLPRPEMLSPDNFLLGN